MSLDKYSGMTELQNQLAEAVRLLRWAEWDGWVPDHGSIYQGCAHCNQPAGDSSQTGHAEYRGDCGSTYMRTWVYKDREYNIHNRIDYPDLKPGEHMPDCPLATLLKEVEQ